MDPSVLQGDRKISFVSYHTRATYEYRARAACVRRRKQNLQCALQRGGKHGSSMIPSCKDAPSPIEG